MDTIISGVNGLLGVLVIAGFFMLAAMVVLFAFRNQSGFARKTVEVLHAHALFFSFFVALGAMLGSIFYSEIAHFPPCNLCWYQRIFMFPVAIMLGMGWRWRDRGIFFYSIPLSAIGALFALYHHFIQLGIMPSIFCSASAVSCVQRFVFERGFVTIPLMSLVAFLLIISFSLFGVSRGFEE
ncbi:MAG TPA: disulfide bond formation protein B [Candidatus Paceibacterota bacterium]